MKSDTIHIRVAGEPSNQSSYDLREIKTLVEEEYHLSINEKTIDIPGSKGIGFVESLEIINVTLSVIGTLFTVLDYWRSGKPQYSIKYQQGSVEIEMSNLSKTEFLELIKELPVNLEEKPIIEITG